MGNKRVSVSPSAVLDEACWALYSSPFVLTFVGRLRKRYDTGPEGDGLPPDSIMGEIFDYCGRFLMEYIFDADSVAALPGGPINAAVLPLMLKDMAGCLTQFVVSGETPRMDFADEVDAQLTYINEEMRPKRGAPKAHEMRAFKRNCESQDPPLTLEEMASEWWELHPDEYPPGTPDDVIIRRLMYRLQNIR